MKIFLRLCITVFFLVLITINLCFAEMYKDEISSFNLSFPNAANVERTNLIKDTIYGEINCIKYQCIHNKDTYSLWCLDYRSIINKKIPAEELIKNEIDILTKGKYGKGKVNVDVKRVTHKPVFKEEKTTKAYEVFFTNFYNNIPLYNRMRYVEYKGVIYVLFVTTLKHSGIYNSDTVLFMDCFYAIW